MIEIKRRNGETLFHLKNDRLSCLISSNSFGKLELIHLGSPVETEDADALRLRSGIGWGSSLIMDDSDNSSCMDVMPLLWSDAGHGDMRDCPISLSRDDVGLCTDFRLVGAETVPSLPSSRLPHGRDGEYLRLTMMDASLRLRLHLYIALYPTAIGFSTCIKNEGTPLKLHRLMSLCADIFGDYKMHSFSGGWISEMQHDTSPVGSAMLVNQSRTGFSSNQHNPGFILAEKSADEFQGKVYVFNIIYSGNHYSSCQRSAQGLTRVLSGISPLHFSKTLEHGQEFCSPQAIVSFSDSGMNAASDNMHCFINNCLIPPYWRERQRPVVYNSWEGCMFSFNENTLLSLARKAKRLGCECFVLDDGWFGNRNDDTSSLGDYDVNIKKLPNGLDGLSDKLRSMGMDFGLWFEPEAVSPDSMLYRQHPEWTICERESPILGRHELLLDLRREDVRNYIVQSLGEIIDKSNIRFVKWDMNRHSTLQGSAAHDYILGLYDVLSRIFESRPQVLLEMCSSGGNRFDLGILHYAPQIWCSDNTDPISRLDIQNSLSYLYPQSCMSCHISADPHAQTLRHTPLETRANVAMFGVFGLELDLRHLLPVEAESIKKQVEYYKEHRKTFQFGKFSRLPAEKDTTLWQISGEKETLVGLFHRLLPPAPGYERLIVKGLDARRRYCISSREQYLRVSNFGSLLKHVLPVSPDPNGTLISTADRLYKMRDGELHCEASGAALSSGIALPPSFCGTGYDKDARNQGDFSSNLFCVKEKLDR